MSFDLERLYALLPATYRIRDIEIAQQAGGLLSDAEQAKLQSLHVAPVPLSAADAKTLRELEAKSQGGPLKALLSVIAEQVAVLEENLDQLYDDQFIETCAEWVVPYIGDLIGARGLEVFPGASFSRRAQVANTISYRRRKGTASVIQQLARDVTDWDASVIEYFKVLATTQYMKHLRPGNLSICDLRNWESLESIGTPFDSVTRTLEVRRIASGRGKYNIPNIGVFLYRIASFELTNVPAYKLDARRYFFNPLGVNTRLYNSPVHQDVVTRLAGRANVAMPIGRRLLGTYLDTYYGVDANGKTKSILIDKDGGVVLGGDRTSGGSPPAPLLSDLIRVCNLSDIKDSGGNVIGWAHEPADKIALDPVLGRIAFPKNAPAPESVHTTFDYGFSAEMAGGQYGRVTTFTTDLKPVVKVPDDKPTIQAALDAVASTGGVVEIHTNKTFVETPVVVVPAATTIELRAAEGFRPVLALSGPMEVTGGDESAVTINGLLISGGNLNVPLTGKTGADNNLQTLNVRHSTLVPGPTLTIGAAPAQAAGPRIVVRLPNTKLSVQSCITGPIQAVNDAAVTLQNSIVDAADETEMAFGGLLGDDAGATLNVSNTTIIGKVHSLMIQLASNTIFLSSMKTFDTLSGPVVAERLQQGCVRFSYIPPGSKVPRPYECQPQDQNEAGRVMPILTSRRYGDAAYCQLSRRCAVEIRLGADDQAEMGAFHDLHEPQREANLRARLDEYLRVGLEAGIFYAS